MALTKVSGPLLHGSNDNLGNYVVNNITGAAATFTGNVSVGGTLTYDDVTNTNVAGVATFNGDVFIPEYIKHLGDTNTRIGFSGTDTFAVDTAGAERLEINSSGTGRFKGGAFLLTNGRLNVNYNIAHSSTYYLDNDAQILVSNGDSTGTKKAVIKLGGEAAFVYGGGSSNLIISDRENERVRIVSTGEVGIGTTNPYTTGAASKHKLTVAADDVLGIGRANTDMFYVRREYEAGKYTFQTINGGNDGNFNIQPFGGEVGIGTKTPDTKLHITTTPADTSAATPLTLQRTHNNNVAVHYENPILSVYAGLAGEGLGWAVGSGPDLGNPNNNQLMVTSAGRIGIGTIAPETNLTIAVNATNQTTATIPTVRLTNTDTTAVASDIVGSYEFFSKDTHSLNKVTGFMRNTPTDAGVNYDLTFGTIKTSDSNAVERVRINSDGRLLISRSGLETSKNVGTKTGEIQVAASGNSAAITLIGFSNDIPGPYLMLGKSRAGNASGNTIVQENDRLGEIAFCGADGNDIDSFGAAIKAWVDGTPGNNDMPGRLAFYTTGSGGASATERMVIKKDGKIGIGFTDPSARLEVRDSASTGIIVRSTSTQSTDTNKALRIRNNSDTNVLSVSHKGLLEIARGEVGTYLKVGGDDASNGRALTFTSSTGDTGSNGALHTLNATSGNGAIALATSGTERIRVNNVGHTIIRRTVGLDLDNLPVGLNTSTNYTLHISNNTNANSKSNGICFGLSSGDGIGAAIVHTRTGSNSYGPLMFATKPNGGDMTERLTIESDGNVTVQGGELGISTYTTNTSVLTFKNSVKDHKIGGVTVEIADNTISPDIQVPGARHGCILFIFSHSDSSGTYPQPGGVGMVYLDVGASPNIRPMFTQSGISSNATTNVGNLIVGENSHETDINNCTDGRLTVMKGSANGRFKLANRLDNSTYTFYLTMI